MHWFFFKYAKLASTTSVISTVVYTVIWITLFINSILFKNFNTFDSVCLIYLISRCSISYFQLYYYMYIWSRYILHTCIYSTYTSNPYTNLGWNMLGQPSAKHTAFQYPTIIFIWMLKGIHCNCNSCMCYSLSGRQHSNVVINLLIPPDSICCWVWPLTSFLSSRVLLGG